MSDVLRTQLPGAVSQDIVSANEAIKLRARIAQLEGQLRILGGLVDSETARALLLTAENQPLRADAERRSIDLPGCVKPDTNERVHFYENDFYVLSNFSAFEVVWLSGRFPTSEHVYHWEKFRRTNPTVAEQIRFAPSAHEAFKLAERSKSSRRKDWDEVKVDVMREILRAKVDQHEYVRRKLLATGDRALIEDSWRDDFWGWGPQRDGQNMLGNLWMEIRSELRASIDKAGGVKADEANPRG